MNNMLYTDRIYGKIEIKEPVIIELINSPTLQRLKEIDQIGYPEPYKKGVKHSRFEHSMGVYILLRKYKAPLEEQIAGLIHDVSHSAFSHCIDYVFGTEKSHEHQDKVFHKFVLDSEIPLILKKHNFDIEYILNENNFPLKERDLPDLCADRIDYSLRTAYIFKEIKDKELEYFFNSLMTTQQLRHLSGEFRLTPLMTKNANWIFKNVESGKKYAELFLKLNLLYYSGLNSAVMFKTVCDYLKHALEKKYITENDLYTTDQEVLNKINTHLNNGRALDGKLKLLYDRMNNKIKYKISKTDHNCHVFCKSRVVDPLCLYKGQVARYSDINNWWKSIVEQESQPKEYFIRFAK